MNVDQSGLYMCTAPGCTQSFQREDHLIIHRHKHEMILKFPSVKSDSTLSDQTPTPTRFLRNCEEVGLFSDLELEPTTEEEEEKEEEDAKQNFSLQGSLSSRQHQPHPPARPPRPPSPARPPRPPRLHCSLTQLCGRDLHVRGPPPHDAMDRQTDTTRSAPSCLFSQQSFAEACAIQETATMHLTMDPGISGIPGPTPPGLGPAHQTSNVMPGQTHAVVSTGNQNTMGHMITGHMMSSQQHKRTGHQLTHLPAPSLHSYQQHCHGQSQQRHTLHHQSQDQSAHSCVHHSPHAHVHQGPAPAAVTHLTHQPLPAQTSPAPKSPSCSHLPPQVSAGKRRQAADEDPDERRRKFLERNRAAASRCRQKRKIWVTSLEKKAEELTHTNLQLENEVTLLRSEVTQLKRILLSHKDCPVTTRQRETQVVGPKGSPAQTRPMQHSSLSASSTTGSSRLSLPSHCAS